MYKLDTNYTIYITKKKDTEQFYKVKHLNLKDACALAKMLYNDFEAKTR